MTNEWQPIETAPKDGTRFLAYGLYNEGLGRFTSIDEGAFICWMKNDAWGSDRYNHLEYCFDERPTHWMPLPLAPK